MTIQANGVAIVLILVSWVAVWLGGREYGWHEGWKEANALRDRLSKNGKGES